MFLIKFQEYFEKMYSCSGAFKDTEHLGSNNYYKNTKELRDSFKEQFNQEGQVEWQWNIVGRTAQVYLLAIAF